VPYLNSAPFFQGLSVGSAELIDCVPRQLGVLAQAGELSAGLMPLVDFVRLRDQFERIGHFGIAVRGRAHSALLFSRRPLRQLDGCAVAVTEESSTTACLVRLLLEQRFHLKPSGYPRGRDPGAEGLVLIGDEALREKYGQAGYPYETDLAFEWWLWQHRPFVFAVWAVRRDLPAQEKKALELGLIRTLAMNLSRLEQIAQEASKTIGIPEETLHLYLSNFVYRLGPSEDEAIATFEELCRRHALL
jgi:chorismate dehydratase